MRANAASLRSIPPGEWVNSREQTRVISRERQRHKAGLVKIIGQNHQFLGVNNATASMLAARKLGHARGGVFLGCSLPWP